MLGDETLGWLVLILIGLIVAGGVWALVTMIWPHPLRHAPHHHTPGPNI